eukprot:4837722-Pyramimonas_sp.AAC.1
MRAAHLRCLFGSLRRRRRLRVCLGCWGVHARALGCGGGDGRSACRWRTCVYVPHTQHTQRSGDRSEDEPERLGCGHDACCFKPRWSVHMLLNASGKFGFCEARADPDTVSSPDTVSDLDSVSAPNSIFDLDTVSDLATVFDPNTMSDLDSFV